MKAESAPTLTASVLGEFSGLSSCEVRGLEDACAVSVP